MTFTGFTPHTKQAELLYLILNSAAKYIVATTGRQFGKTILAENLLLYWAINNAPAKILWVSPVYSQCEKVQKELYAAIAESGLVESCNYSSNELTLKTNSTIYFRSAERYDNIRGGTYDFAIIDEAAFIKDEAWNEAIKPTLLVKGKKVLFISTPKGKNYFYNLYQLGQDADRLQYKAFKATSYDTPYITKEDLEDAKKTVPDNIFKQEYLAEFIDNGGEVFSNLEAHSFTEWPKSQGRIWAGLDLGKQEDYTVLTFVNEQGQVVDIYRDNQAQWSQMITNIVDKCRQHNADLLVEVNGIGDPLFEQIKKQWQKTEPFTTTNKSKQDAIEGLILDLNEDKVQIPHQTLFGPLWHEMEVFTYEYNPRSRTVRYTHPSGLHDDCVMSLALANYNRRTNITRGQYAVMGRR